MPCPGAQCVTGIISNSAIASDVPVTSAETVRRAYYSVIDSSPPGGTLDDSNLLINPDELAPAIGFSHAVLASTGRTVYLAGQVAFDSEGQLVGDTWTDQFDQALSNLATALAAAGGEPEDLTWIQIFTVDVAAYRAARPDLGPVYRRHLGRHYPAMGLYGVTELADIGAVVELTGIAVIAE